MHVTPNLHPMHHHPSATWRMVLTSHTPLLSRADRCWQKVLCICSSTSPTSAHHALDVARYGCPAGDRKLRLTVGSHMIPHPEKADKGGEDAFFVTNSRRMFGEHPLQLPLHSCTFPFACSPFLCLCMLPEICQCPHLQPWYIGKGERL